MAREEYNFVSRGTSRGVFDRVYHITKDLEFNKEVGLVFVEVVQPTRKSHPSASAASCKASRTVESHIGSMGEVVCGNTHASGVA